MAMSVSYSNMWLLSTSKKKMGLYEAYTLLQSMSFEEFEKLVARGWLMGIPNYLIIALIMFLIGRRSKYKLDSETNRKLQQICRWEERPIRYQVKHIIEMYVEAYTEKNGIDWEQRLF